MATTQPAFRYGSTFPCAYKFTGKERDSESGLDMFGARYYGSSLARFMTPDWAAKPTAVPYAHFGNPQSLNLYSYVQNNPTTVGDPDGHCTDPLSCGVEFAGIGTLIEPGGGTVIGAALGGIVIVFRQPEVSIWTKEPGGMFDGMMPFQYKSKSVVSGSMFRGALRESSLGKPAP